MGTVSSIGTSSLFSGLVTNNSGTGPTATFNGVISGINTQQIIQALMTAYEIPQTELQGQITTMNANLSAYQQIAADLTNLQSAADNISQTQLWNQTVATSNNTQVATATSSPSAPQGSVSFNVLQLAQAQTIASQNTVSSTSTVVDTSPFLLSGTAYGYGVTSLTGSGLALGTHNFAVTTALSGGTAVGSKPLASSVTITSGVNDQIAVNVNGTAQTFTLAAGTYTPAQLAAAVSSASVVSGSPLLQAQVNAQGEMKVGTTLLGSSASLQVTGGDALSSLGMVAQTTASVGTAGSITVDGTANSVNNINANTTVSLAGVSGATVTMGVGSFGLNAGSFTASEVSPGGGTLADVVSAINAAGAGVTASAVQVASGAYRLQMSSSTTGTAGQIVFDSSGFTSVLGGFNTITSAQDAKLQVGGTSGYTVDSGSNAVTGLLSGVTINLLSAQNSGATPVTVTVGANGQAMASSVQTMITDANQALADINKYAGYNSTTGKGGPLMGDANLNLITNQILGTVANVVGSGTLIGAGSVGVAVTQSGTLTFDSTTFLAAYQANPTGVAQMFSQQGTFAPSASQYAGTVGFSFALDSTPAGNYPITVSQSATQATDTGSVLSTGTITAAETLGFTQGTLTGSYAATAGESLTTIASGLNSMFSKQGITLYASVQTVSGGSQLVVNSVNYGSAQTFSVTSNATGTGQTGLAGSTGSASFAGLDVKGTIDGIAATGSGQSLSVPFSSSTIPGFAVNVTASGITSSTNIGTIDYTTGIAGGLANISALAADPITGSVSGSVSSLQNQIVGLQAQYNSYTPMIQAEQQLLTNEFAQMESQLSTLNNQSQWLSGQISKLP